jgi:hypothetical protein
MRHPAPHSDMVSRDMANDDLLTTIPFDEAHPPALALYCSDGRFTRAVEELVLKLGHPRLDTLTMPGGPGLLDADAARLAESSSVRRGMSFLIAGHKIRRVILVSHQGCGYYRLRYSGRSAEEIIQLQLEQLRTAERWLKTAHPGVEVSLHFARAEKGAGIAFTPVSPSDQ